jgi:RNA-directed DNA polymerase
LNNKSRLSREAPDRICESLRVRFPWATRRIITGSSKEILEQEIKPLVEKFLQPRGLEISPEKTKIVHINEGFDFLGQNIRKYRGKLLIKPSKGNVKSFLKKVREIIKGNKTSSTANLIKLLNPVIRGWANYHRHVVASKTFNYIDSEIWRALWCWAICRHPHKNKYWIKDKYFKVIQSRRWVFAGKTGLFTRDGNPEWITLSKASDIPIKRYVKIKAEANPFDPTWEHYFEERLNFKMRDTLQMKKRLLILWSEQAGKCPCCKQSIEEEERWHVHHILPKCKGGKDTLDNLVLVHPNCHRQIHSQNLTVVKPASARKH